MPILVTLKQPSQELAIKDFEGMDLARAEDAQKFGRALGGLNILVAETVSGQPVWIVQNQDSNIAWMVQVSEEEYQKMKKQRTEAQKRRREQGMIQSPRMVIPSGPKGKN